ncbi:DNA gyrase inhibitor YacG [Thermodesulfatator autotrophicus]|uniref:Zinc-binding protein n=1 Tax=Thermodesulfatator autotrophicus TaxID=1795632 RepID=A0A177E600_9BACT|nr:DNA gyrase inhibitor YacG [Thermodesulfatator autotrophicus]OAG26860.1 zinc-binding protein [Thermodesulfatator autotrophicus]
MKKKIKCPQCGKLTFWEENPYRPFCSERCKLIDLGHWLSEEYRIRVPADGVEEVHQEEEK